MFILQLPPTSIIHKMATEDPCRTNSIYNLFFAYLGWRKILFGQRYEKTLGQIIGPVPNTGALCHIWGFVPNTGALYQIWGYVLNNGALCQILGPCTKYWIVCQILGPFTKYWAPVPNTGALCPILKAAQM